MENTSYIILSRESSLRREMSVIANNLANMNTHGYKGERMMFVDHLVRSKGGESMLGTKNAFVRDVASYRVQEEGPIIETDNPLDLAVHGDGYFVVDTPSGPRYTRDGHFQLNDTGQLVTSNGNPVMGQGGPITFAPDDVDIRISRDGSITTNNGNIAKLSVVTFENAHKLKREAGALYASDAPGQEATFPNVVQGAIEGSNIQPILEMTRMIDVHRAYQGATKFIEQEDDRIKKLGSILVGQG
ncbi:flagellar basal-body rod protein FlgF [Magnetospira thiophila]